MRPKLVEHVIESAVTKEIKSIRVSKPPPLIKKTPPPPRKSPVVINHQINSFVLNILAVSFIGICLFCLYYRKKNKEDNKVRHEDDILSLERNIHKYNLSK